MDADHLRELIELEDSYWWHTAKRRLVVELLDRHAPPPGLVVEGGIGSARNLVEFRDRGYDVMGLDVMPESVEHAQSRDLPAQLHDLSLPWPALPQPASAVVLLDVLEHIADPVAVLRNANSVLKPGGVVIATVPAYGWLYGTWDRRLGHYRRYSRSMVRREASAAGFAIKRLTHWNSFTLPPAIAVRIAQRLRPCDQAAEFPRVSRMTNRLLEGCAAAERRWLRWAGIPCGLSLVAVLQKRMETKSPAQHVRADVLRVPEVVRRFQFDAATACRVDQSTIGRPSRTTPDLTSANAGR